MLIVQNMILVKERITIMLIKSKSLKGYKLNSLDGEIGNVKEFYFDDNYWTIRYLVIETGGWLTSQQVLISPHALIAVNQEEKYISINLTKKQIENSPPLEYDKPVSRQFEKSYYEYYGYPLYWAGAYMWGPYPYIPSDTEKWIESDLNEKAWDSHLRSTYDVSDYSIHATDGEIGHIDDFIIDVEKWAIRYLIVDTRNWWLGKKVLLSTQWIKNISWKKKEVSINLVQEAIKLSPKYTEEALINRDYEKELHMHYNQKGYWVDEQPKKED